MPSIFNKKALAILTSCLTLTSPSYTKDMLDFRTECVGRMQLSLPADVEVAAYSVKSLKERIASGGYPDPQFDDGENAGFSRMHYNGPISISNKLSNSQIFDIKKSFFKSKDDLKNIVKKSGYAEQRKAIIETISTGNNASAFRNGSSIESLIQLDQHLLYTQIDSEDDVFSHTQSIFEELLKKTIHRPLFLVQRNTGICLPHAFINDSGIEDRQIATTYRLRSHPDVTIWLQDKKAGNYSDKKSEAHDLMRYWINDFWGQYSRNGVKVSSKWKFPSGRTVQIDRRDGLASFVQITRKDGSEDFAYLAVLRGDPEAGQDTPDLRFYVMRHAARAKAKGIEPMDEKEFLALAQAIAASIKHRPTSPDASHKLPSN